MQSIIQTRYYNIGEGNLVKYLVQTQSQAKSSGIKLPKVHGVDKEIRPNVEPKEHGIKPIADTKTKEVFQTKPRLGQGRAGLRHKIKTPIPIAQATEKQPNVLAPDTPKMQDKIKPKPNFVMPQMKHRGDTRLKKTIQDVPIYPDPVY